MKVLILADIEGASGVSDYRQIAPFWGKKGYDYCIECITKDINAVIRGLVKANVDSIDIFDGHGNGGNLKKDKIEGNVRIVENDILKAARNEYDALIMVGQHACAGTLDGFLSHTFSPDYALKMNDKYFGEIAFFSLLFGSFGTKTLLISGDDAAVREANALLPGVAGVIVKNSKSRTNTVCIPLESSVANIEEKAYDVIQKIDSKSSYEFNSKIHLEIEFSQPDMAKMLENYPGFERKSEKAVQFIANNFIDVYKANLAANLVSSTYLTQMTLNSVFRSKGILSLIQKLIVGKLLLKMWKEKISHWVLEKPPFEEVKY